MSDVPAPQPGDNLRRIFERLRAARLARGGDAPGAYESAFEKGAAGELRFGTTLNEAAAFRGGCWVLHGLVAADKRGDIDHLVIGPAGVTAIDTKAWTGKVWIGRLGLGRGRSASPSEIEGMSRQINRVHEELAKNERDDVPITGVLCMVNENPGTPAVGFADIRGVRVGRPNAAIHHALRDGPLDAATIEIVHRLVASRFSVHGGSQAPTPRAARTTTRATRSAKTRSGLRNVARTLLAAAVALTALAAAVALITTGVESSEKHFRTFSRDDLNAERADLRKTAVSRAHGKVRGPSIRESGSYFTLTYRRGRHCRIVINVLRAVPLLNGGSRTVTASGCGRRRSYPPASKRGRPSSGIGSQATALATWMRFSGRTPGSPSNVPSRMPIVLSGSSGSQL